MVDLCIVCADDARRADAQRTARQLDLSVLAEPDAACDFALMFEAQSVRLRSVNSRQGDIVVDFCAGSAAHRRQFGGGKGQLIAKAVGLKSGVKPPVYDMTAGLGGDAFVLACLGCEVTMVERNPVVYALLADGLARARAFAQEQDPALLATVERMHLIAADGVQWLRQAEAKLPVIYLDPMFPERRKSAGVKKEMHTFHSLVGADADAADLLEAALAAVEYRVVVKRPRIAPHLAQRQPSLILEGKSSRFDIYALKSLSRDH